MAGKREERERLRQERLAAQKRTSSEERRRQIMGYAVAGLLVAIVIVGIVVVVTSGGDGGGSSDGSDAPDNAFINTSFGGTTAGVKPDGREGTAPPEPRNLNLRLVARQAGCKVREHPDEGNKHVNIGTKVSYKTNPPTSGSHYPPEQLQADGAYREYPDPRRTVHSLEHGRVAIQYSPELPEERQLMLKGLFEEDPRGMLLFPNPRLRVPVAAAAWRNSITCARWSEGTIDALRAFKEELRGQGPEDVPF